MENSKTITTWGTSKAAEQWKAERDTVSRWCREGKVKGAVQDGVGKPWRIPSDAIPPNK